MICERYTNAGTFQLSMSDISHVTCSNGSNGDMFMDYMDYVNDNCMAMFTEGQNFV